jgi:hypothetical protein
VTPAILKTLKELMSETNTNEKDICEVYGVDELSDLFSDEAGKITTTLLKKKQLGKTDEAA